MNEENNIKAEVQWGVVQDFLDLLKTKLCEIPDSSPHYSEAQVLYANLNGQHDWTMDDYYPFDKDYDPAEDEDPGIGTSIVMSINNIPSPNLIYDTPSQPEKPKAKRGRKKQSFLIDPEKKQEYVDALAYLINIYYKPQLDKMQIDKSHNLLPSIFFTMVFTASIEYGFAEVCAPVKAFGELFDEAREQSSHTKETFQLGYEAINDQVRNITRLVNPYSQNEKKMLYNISQNDLHKENYNENRRRLQQFKLDYEIVKQAMRQHQLFNIDDDQ